jgi:hypothetical protein
LSEFSITPEMVRSGAQTLFTASEEIYSAMRALADDSDGLEGGAETAGFTGIAEALKASRLWESDYIAAHRADIEDTAMLAAVSAESSEEVDGHVASAFDRYADSYFPEGRTAPAPERPAPAAHAPRGGESVAV